MCSKFSEWLICIPTVTLRITSHHDDVEILRRTIFPPTERPDSSSGSLTQNSLDGNHPNSERMPTIGDVQLGHLSTIPFRLSCVCRRIHDVLTGPKAAQRVEQHGLIDASGMREIWYELDQCWQGLSAMKDNVALNMGKVNTENFVDAWLVSLPSVYVGSLFTQYYRSLSSSVVSDINLISSSSD